MKRHILRKVIKSMVWVLLILTSSLSAHVADSCNMRLVQKFVYRGAYLTPWVSSIDVSNHRLAAVLAEGGVHFYNILPNGLLDSSCVYDRVTNSVKFINDTTFVYCYFNCLVSVNIPQGSTEFTVLDSIYIPAGTWLSEMVVIDNIAYLKACTGFSACIHLADVSDPESLVYLSRTASVHNSATGETAFCVDPPYIYHCGGQRVGDVVHDPWDVPFVAIFDATNPLSPAHLVTDFYLGVSDMMRYASSITVKDTFLYLGGAGDNNILKIRNDRTDTDVIAYDYDTTISQFFQTIFYDTLLYSSGFRGMALYNISDPTVFNRIARYSYFTGQGKFFAAVMRDTLIYAIYSYYPDSFGVCVFDVDLGTSGNCELQTLPESYGMSIYPNPSNSSCTININSASTNGNLSLYNVKGQKVGGYTKIHSPAFINLDTGNFESGLYIARYETQSSVETSLFVVMK